MKEVYNRLIIDLDTLMTELEYEKSCRNMEKMILQKKHEDLYILQHKVPTGSQEELSALHEIINNQQPKQEQEVTKLIRDLRLKNKRLKMGNIKLLKIINSNESAKQNQRQFELLHQKDRELKNIKWINKELQEQVEKLEQIHQDPIGIVTNV